VRNLGAVCAGLTAACTVSFPELPELEEDRVGPARVNDLAARLATATSPDLVWTAPGDDGLSGTPASVDLRYVPSEDPASLDGETFADATAVLPAPEPAEDS